MMSLALIWSAYVQVQNGPSINRINIEQIVEQLRRANATAPKPQQRMKHRQRSSSTSSSQTIERRKGNDKSSSEDEQLDLDCGRVKDDDIDR
jgi:hypothetical protein